MQVRKFEAKTMKEALDLVKSQMGPEAIILSAKDNNKSFGLMGGSSVEVTAAITNETLKKKLLAEKKMKEEARLRFQKASARDQKQFIEKVFKKVEAPSPTPAAQPSSRPLTKVPYIDIFDEMTVDHGPVRRPSNNNAPTQRYATSAAQAPNLRMAPQQSIATYIPPQAAPLKTERVETQKVEMLETQIQELKSMLDKFNKVPQSFVGAHPGAEEGIPYHLSEVYQRLQRRGINAELIVKAIRKAQATLGSESSKKAPLVEGWIVQHFLKSLMVSDHEQSARYHVFVGSTGQGKTTSLVKFASQLIMRKKKRVAIVSLDTVKVGASDQLKIYAQILNVPFAVIRNAKDWDVLESKLDRVDHILVDAPGFTLKGQGEAQWLKELLPPSKHGRELHLVQSIVARDEDVMGLAERYMELNFNDVIFTRIDESSRQGVMINFQNQFKKPIHSIGLGVQIPEDYELATKERIIDLIFRITG